MPTVKLRSFDTWILFSWELVICYLNIQARNCLFCHQVIIVWFFHCWLDLFSNTLDLCLLMDINKIILINPTCLQMSSMHVSSILPDNCWDSIQDDLKISLFVFLNNSPKRQLIPKVVFLERFLLRCVLCYIVQRKKGKEWVVLTL